MSAPQPDPFDTSQVWPVNRQMGTPRPNYDIQINEPSIYQNNSEPHRYSNNKYSASTSTDISQTYNNMTDLSMNNSVNASPLYGTAQTTYANAISVERNVPTSEPSIAVQLAEMSLDDRISASLNLKTKNSNTDNIYANSSYAVAPMTSSTSQIPINDRYNDIPIYKTFDLNPVQQHFVLETKDYYTKSSIPTGTRTRNDYEKNIYVPKYEEEAEKLRNFSESLENSKNYSAMKYQNVGNYFYASSFGSVAGSMSYPETAYDMVNDTSSNVYSEIGESSQNVYGNQGQYSGLYDEVYEESTPRPHRPAPPCPTNNKPK